MDLNRSIDKKKKGVIVITKIKKQKFFLIVTLRNVVYSL